MKFKDRLGIRFIRASIHFIPTDNLYGIIALCNDENEEIVERDEIVKVVNQEINDRNNGKLYKVIRGVKEVWIEKKRI